MKKLLILLLFFGFSLGQDVLSTHPNGEPKEVGTFKDGEPYGLFKTYHENGQLESEITYKDGIEDGPYKYYNENGQLEIEGTLKDGVLIDFKEY